MKKLINLAVITIAISLIVSIVMSDARDKFIEFERSGTMLQVPQQYLYENRFPWIDEATGLDSDEMSFLIRVSSDEVKQFLPTSVSEGKLEPTDLVVVVYVLSSAGKQSMVNNKRTSFDEIVKRDQNFAEAYEVLDEEMGWYRVYQNPRLASRWYVFLQSPYSGKDLIGVDSLLALCQEDYQIGKQCQMTAAIFDDVAIEMNLRYEHLPYYKDIQNYVVGLVNSWRK